MTCHEGEASLYFVGANETAALYQSNDGRVSLTIPIGDYTWLGEPETMTVKPNRDDE